MSVQALQKLPRKIAKLCVGHGLIPVLFALENVLEGVIHETSVEQRGLGSVVSGGADL